MVIHQNQDTLQMAYSETRPNLGPNFHFSQLKLHNGLDFVKTPKPFWALFAQIWAKQIIGLRHF